MTKEMSSTKGNLVAKDVLKMMEKLTTAMAKSVPCQDLDPYISLFKMIKP
jgi:hypothetical protein